MQADRHTPASAELRAKLAAERQHAGGRRTEEFYRHAQRAIERRLQRCSAPAVTAFTGSRADTRALGTELLERGLHERQA